MRQKKFNLILFLCTGNSCRSQITTDPAEKTGTEEEILAEFRVVRDAIQMWLQVYFEVFPEAAGDYDKSPA